MTWCQPEEAPRGPQLGLLSASPCSLRLLHAFCICLSRLSLLPSALSHLLTVCGGWAGSGSGQLCVGTAEPGDMGDGLTLQRLGVWRPLRGGWTSYSVEFTSLEPLHPGCLVAWEAEVQSPSP